MKLWKASIAAAVLSLGLSGCVYYPAGEPDRYVYEPAYVPPAVYLAPSANFYYSSGHHYHGRGYGRHWR